MKLCITIKPNEAGGYTAECPALPGCRCRGRTIEEARSKINDTVCGYLASVGNFVPEKISWVSDRQGQEVHV